MNDGQTFALPASASIGTPTWKVGLHHGLSGRPMVVRDNITYADGWAEGYARRTGHAQAKFYRLPENPGEWLWSRCYEHGVDLHTTEAMERHTIAMHPGANRFVSLPPIAVHPDHRKRR